MTARWTRLALVAATMIWLSVQQVAWSAAVKEEDPLASGPQTRDFQQVLGITTDISVTQELRAYHRKSKQGWRQACSRLVSVFSGGGGLWESGPAASATCKVGKQQVSGSGKPAASDLRINVDIARVADTVELSLSIPGIGSQKPVARISKVALPLTEWTPEFLSDQEFASLVAYALLDGSPVMAQLDRSRLSIKNNELRVAEYKTQDFKTRKFDQVMPPQALAMYRLEREQGSGRFHATHLGDAKFIKTEKVKVKTGKGGGVRTTFMPTARYSVDAKLKAFTGESGPVWIHVTDGSGTRREALVAAVNDAHERLTGAARSGLLDNLFSKGYESISDLIFQTAASGYVGLRYGRQLLQGNKLLEGGAMYGLLVEVRSGPLNGLKFYYDKFPITEYSTNGTATNLEWSRLVLGKSFSLGIPFVVNRFEITPKLGRYFLSSVQPVETDESGNIAATQRFEIRNQPSFSVEVSAERAAKLYTARLWYAIDRGIPFLPLIGTSAVSAERAGADLFLNSGISMRLFGDEYTLNMLAFGLYENLLIEDLKLEDLQPGQVAVSAIQLRAAYAGLGMVINW